MYTRVNRNQEGRKGTSDEGGLMEEAQRGPSAASGQDIRQEPQDSSRSKCWWGGRSQNQSRGRCKGETLSLQEKSHCKRKESRICERPGTGGPEESVTTGAFPDRSAAGGGREPMQMHRRGQCVKERESMWGRSMC